MPFTVRAPGRVNLIGEHTDYNDGFVMPAAIGYETRVEAQEIDGTAITIDSASLGETVSFDIGALTAERRGDWTDYARGVLLELMRSGVALQATALRVASDIPLGGGLSSSASFEVALALALLRRAGRSMDRIAIAQLAQRAEVEHVGTRSGIMDQFAVLFGKRNCVTLLDTRSLAYEYRPIPDGTGLVICNTMVKHSLASGAYNERRAQCEAAVEMLRRWYPEIRALRDVTQADLERHADDLPPLLYRRSRHVVSENARVCEAADALAAGDGVRVGALMNASHESLRADYEVSCDELEAMVEIARRCDGVYGARMTGGGFGGCTVNLVDAAGIPAFRRTVAEAYERKTGIVPDLYDGTPVAGASSIDG